MSSNKAGPKQNLARLAQELQSSLREESDRALAVIAAAYLDHQLDLLLRHHMKLPDPAGKYLFDDFRSPLATFGGRIQMAAHMGLVTAPQLKDLERIKKIRNLFAHEPLGTTFSSSRIADLSRALTFVESPEPQQPRERFESSVFRLMVDITSRLSKTSTGARTQGS